MKYYHILTGEIREMDSSIILSHLGTPKEGIWQEYVAPEVEESVPEAVTPRQLLLVLNDMGITISAIKQSFAAIANDRERRAAEIEFDMASEFKRSHPLVSGLAYTMGLTPGQVDSIFIAASKL